MRRFICRTPTKNRVYEPCEDRYVPTCDLCIYTRSERGEGEDLFERYPGALARYYAEEDGDA